MKVPVAKGAGKLMILGAGAGQLPAIEIARCRGFHVITVDYLPDNIGHRYSDQFENCSTVDREAVLMAARRAEIDGILTVASDVATATVSYVADKLGLAGGRLDAVETMAHKARFRRFQREQGLNGPQFVSGSAPDLLWEAWQSDRLLPPLVVKPVDTSGSRGVVCLDNVTEPEFLDAVATALSFSLEGSACVEEFIEGTEVGGDAFLIGGTISFIGITRKHKRGLTPEGHSLPTMISTDQQQWVREELDETCRRLGYAEGPLNFDVVVSSERAVVLELSARLGGNGIGSVIKRATGADLYGMNIDYSMGLPIEIPAPAESVRPCGSWMISSGASGTLESIASAEQVKQRVPEVLECVVVAQPGERVEAFSHSGTTLGYVVFDISPNGSYESMVRRIRESLELRVACDLDFSHDDEMGDPQ